tara:strand:- start:96 stop:1337 length:1242 start_codon:yes stop_codon:yes gene_type:complete
MSKIDTGREGQNIPDDFSIPSCGIEDVDRALFNLFDKRLKFEVMIDNQATKVPVVFAAGERFALTRRDRPIRDRNNALILPLISIVRKSIDHSPNLGGYGTAIAPRDQDFYTVKRRLSKKDRAYQNLINKQKLKNQDNVAHRSHFLENSVFPGNDAVAGKLVSRRNGPNLSFYSLNNPGTLSPDLSNNIFEIITIPYPEFFVADFEVTFWTQYMQQSNQMLEILMDSFDGQGHEFLIKTDKGYEFVAYINSNIAAADNFDDFSSDERIIKHSFGVKVPAFLLAVDRPGTSLPFRRFLSAPQINFGIHQISRSAKKSKDFENAEDKINKFILSDTSIVDSDGDKPLRRGEDGTELLQELVNPFTGKSEKKYMRVLTTNQRAGETVASSKTVVKIERVEGEVNPQRAPKIDTFHD